MTVLDQLSRRLHALQAHISQLQAQHDDALHSLAALALPPRPSPSNNTSTTQGRAVPVVEGEGEEHEWVPGKALPHEPLERLAMDLQGATLSSWKAGTC